MTSVLAMPAFKTDMGPHIMNGSLLSTMMAGAFVSALVSGPLADTIGRRGLLSLGIAIFVVGDVLLTGADDLGKIYAGRALTGISIGYKKAALLEPTIAFIN